MRDRHRGTRGTSLTASPSDGRCRRTSAHDSLDLGKPVGDAPGHRGPAGSDGSATAAADGAAGVGRGGAATGVRDRPTGRATDRRSSWSPRFWSPRRRRRRPTASASRPRPSSTTWRTPGPRSERRRRRCSCGSCAAAARARGRGRNVPVAAAGGSLHTERSRAIGAPYGSLASRGVARWWSACSRWPKDKIG
jgi:hypothetical protein